MATDITIPEDSGATPRTFEAFANDELPTLARAIAVVANDEARSANALTHATQALFVEWDAIGSPAEQQLYATAIDELLTIEDGEEAPASGDVLSRACVVAHLGLGWSIDGVAATLELTPDDVSAHVAQARAACSDEDLQSMIRRQLTETQVHLPDIATMRRERRATRRRNRLVGGAVGLGVLALLLVLLAQFGRNRDRSDPSPVPSSTAAAPAVEVPPARASPSETATDSSAATPADVGQLEPSDDVLTFVPPDLVADDGQGGFVGVRAGQGQEAPAVFLTLREGLWRSTAGLDLSPLMTVDRFERSGENFVAWLSGVTTPTTDEFGTLATTPDFALWNFLQLTIDEPAPRGLDYDFELSHVAFRETTVFALVTTTVEINFPELQLIESSTCGQSVEADAVVVKLCNGGEIDVLSVAGIEQLPASTRLFTGIDGSDLTEVDIAFLQDDAGLISTNDALLVTDATGRWIATSADGQTWSESDTSWPAGEIRAAATNDAGHVVSVVIDSEPLLYTNRGDELQAEPLLGLLPELDRDADFDVAISASVETWAVYLSTTERTWLLTSAGGEAWLTTEFASSQTGSPDLFVGDEQVIVQWPGEPDSLMVIEFG